ncbi:bifunctional phosphopantothenoylcysteine decarboxylase/phosphopantothenate--cysteine ligase CoaBC [Thermosulfurimonas marina]|uniref:Coenzyme A biosynthesis bifunctional protein CoaBC n=1 Tax=Thermosulfurimonas marina TaxID=2047767 RepID=A0A6H1WR48_9BACT|nr:bifunctional phosphopantothenoylcysteine decarboxylase/phosphopantothenate--cysteine ligase CoaBC [Thermosulfurimonas marina]QJA05663.1 bifunctional phosphopantothenoylcysteine decarboxylase/phosphopantothenate--cysteine ligase CoaBC [Thermosulfurimonas marina]
MLEGRQILLGICGGIAAYKSAELCRALVRQGARVRTVLTTGAEAFVSPLLFETLSRDRAFRQRDFLAPQGGLIPHTDLAAWAEAVVVAPATASFLAKLSRGEPSDLLTAIIMAFSGPVLLAPAMNVNMWRHPATQENVARLREFGYRVVEPGEGALACGLSGPGRLPPLEDLLFEIESLLSEKPLSGKRVLITGGPTREPIDAVRFISNPSSGRMAVALARAALLLGAEVHLVHGPLSVAPPKGVRTYPVGRAEEMLAQARRLFPECEIAILAAAVCDLAPERGLPGKTPKEDLPRELRLRPTPDIARELAAIRRPGQILVGFALEERERLPERALKKLSEKGFDFLAANPLESFEAEDTEVLFFSSQRPSPQVFKGSKERVALDLLREVARALCGQT